MDFELYSLAKEVGLALKGKKLSIVVAESCTGGLLSASLTDVAGSSDYFERGFVTYSDIAKKEDLGVKSETLEKFGAVSEEVAEEMAEGALKNSDAKISLAITGIAGPSGGSKDKPVGMVCFAMICLELPVRTVTMHFKGDRNTIRVAAVEFALRLLLESIGESSPQ